MGENDSNLVRFRLVFEDHNLLDKSQCSQGLRRCWFLLNPDITCIGDLASQIRKRFGLRHRIVLYMDDFVLPSFESTCIITDKDIIRVRRKETKQKDMCEPCDAQDLLQDSENARVQDLNFSENLLLDVKSQENSQENRSCDKEILTSCMENSVHLDSLGDVGSIKRNRRCSKKLLDSEGQYDKSNHETKFEHDNTSDMRKKKQARPQMVSHSSDEEEDVLGSVVRSDSIQFQPQEHGTQEADETQEPVLFDGGSSIKELDRNKENTFQQSTKNDQRFSGDGAPVFDGILPLPKTEGMPLVVNITKPLPKTEGMPSVVNITKPLPKTEGLPLVVNITKPLKHTINFETLIPLRRLPLKGDILAYRYVESSSMSSQLSSPQVGEVSSFDNKTLQIILRPVQDYVFLLDDENLRGTTGQSNASRCKEDGSLEIEFLSLVDVRLVKAHSPEEEEKACQDDQDRKDNWEEALLKGNLNEPNVFTAEQSNSWAPWIPNKSAAAVMSWSFNQPIAPFAGRGNGRSNWGGPNRGMNNRIPNRNAANWNPRRNTAAWNSNRNNTRVNPPDHTAAVPWSFGASGFPNPWEYHHGNNMFTPPGKFSGPGNQ